MIMHSAVMTPHVLNAGTDGVDAISAQLGRPSPGVPSPSSDIQKNASTHAPTNGHASRKHDASTKHAIRNYKRIDNGHACVPLSLREIVDNIRQVSGGWPCCVGPILFVDDGGGLRWIEKDRVNAVFAWLRSIFDVDWKNGGNFVTKAELVCELVHVANEYQTFETLPHFPKVKGAYYKCQDPAQGEGENLNWLLDRFRPATDLDRELIKTAILTMFWGGAPGMRPLFVFTSDDGRGAGKTLAASIITHLAGDYIDLDARGDIEQFKTRLLSADGMVKRAVLIDNLKTRKFSWDALEKLITATTISGKRNYCGEGSRPNFLTWFATLNGVSFDDDLSQRAVIIKLRRGKNLGAWYEETLEYIDKHRDRIIGDIRATLEVPQPDQVDAIVRPGAWVNGVLARLPQLEELQKLIAERQQETNCETDEVQLLEDCFAEKLRKSGVAPATSRVHIPAAIAADWYNEAMGEKLSKNAASSALKQLTTETTQAGKRKCQRIERNSSNVNGRGYIWTGESVAYGTSVDYVSCERLQGLPPSG